MIVYRFIGMFKLISWYMIYGFTRVYDKYLPEEGVVFYTDFPHAFSVPTGHKLESNQALELFKLQTKMFHDQKSI